MLTITKNKITSSFWVRLLPVIVILCVLPLFLSEGWVSLVAEMLILALAATAVNLLLGYCGLVSFGHAGFFAVGAYTFGLLVYYDLAPFGVAFILAILAATLFGIITGWFAIRLRTIYFALFTLAASMVIWVAASISYGVTGGDDGLTGIPVPSMFYSITNSYYFILVIVGICLFVLYLIGQSPFGSALNALRENLTRAGHIGINTKRYVYIAFVISSLFVGIAGVLMTIFIRCAFPGYAGFMKSGDFIIACLIGGMYNFTGPILGAFVFIYIDKLITGYTEYWPLVLGCVILFIALFFRGGIVGFTEEKYRVYKLKGGKSQ